MKKYKSYFLSGSNRCFILLSFTITMAFSCSRKNYSSLPVYQFKALSSVPDYSNLAYWAAHPWKKDPSDSIPKPLRSVYIGDSAADVFFIHPTTLTSAKDPRWNADIDDPELNTKTDYSTILYQASVFNDRCRVFAPRYRHAHLRSFFSPDSVSGKYFDTAYEDIKNAFLYYITHYNHGRPIIIASHSQGTKHAARLLKEFFENKPLMNKLVCAYIIGLPVPEKYFTSLKPCRDSLSTGCFVSWRTFKTGYTEPEFVAKEKFKVDVVNPLSWSCDSGFYASSFNKGGILLKFNKLIPNAVSAEIHHNVLWTSKPNIFGKILLKKKNYHAGDINLFYVNIRENVSQRINAYLRK
jgi:hypothetical protein